MTIKEEKPSENAVATAEMVGSLDDQAGVEHIPFANVIPEGEFQSPGVVDVPEKPSVPNNDQPEITPTANASVVVTQPQFTQPVTTTNTFPTIGVSDGPANAPPGGRWAHVTRWGPTTWTICGIVSGITCFCCCLPCGLWALLCPCDSTNAYVAPDGRVFNNRGEFIGNARNMRIRYV